MGVHFQVRFFTIGILPGMQYMYTSWPVCLVYPDSLCTALCAEGHNFDVGHGFGKPMFETREVVDAKYVVEDTVQFVFSIGDPTRRLYPAGATDS